jgi:raffinose/stachyose/melibiose transport system substrate-binding protein
MKRLVSLFLGMLLLVFVGLTGCTSSSSTEPDSNKNDSGDQKGEKVTLTIGSWRTEDTAAYEKMIAAFNEKYPDIEVQFKPSKNTEYDTLLNTALQSGEGPDIIQLRPYAPGMELAKAGYLEPLDDIEGIDVFPDHVIEAAKGEDGKIYGVPLSINSAQIFYNKKIFDKYGLKEPKTWDELVEVAKTLKDNGVTPFAFGSKDGWLLSLTHAITGPAQYGGNDFVNKILKGETDFRSEPFVNSIKALYDLKPYFPENFEGLGMEDIRTLFFTEQAAMFPMGSWEIEVLRQMNPDLEFDFFPTPSATGGEPTLTTWVDGSFGINAKSKHKEEAKKFIQFMTTKEFGQLFSKELKRISAVPGVTTEDPLVSKMADAAASSSTPYLILVHFNKGTPTTKDEIQNSLQGMFLDQIKPEDVAKKVQESAATWFEPFK